MTNHLLKVRTLLTKQKVEAILISSVPNIIYLTNFSNFSIFEREAFLIITKNNQYIITDGRYSEAVVEKIPHFKLLEISSENKLQDILKQISEKDKVNCLGYEASNLTVNEYSLLKKSFPKLKNVTLDNLRSIKDEKEISLIEKACLLGDRTFNHILKKIKPGISELKLVFEIESYIKKNNADISFKPIVAFGKNSSVPHHQPEDRKLKTENIILLDFGVKLNNYCSDMTRTVFIGKATNEQKKIYQTVLDAQSRAIELLSDKSSIINLKSERIKASRVDDISRTYIVKSGYPTIPHSLGHGIGIEVHEAPRLGPNSKDILKPGMVFSIEPGIYIPGFGGVRIEDLVVIDYSGPHLLTHSSNKLIEL